MSVITLSDSRLGKFYPQNSTFDILTCNFSNQTALSQLNWQGLDQATIVDLLKQYQRLLRLNPNPIIAQNLLTGSQTPIPPSPTPTTTPPSDSSTPRVGAAPGEPGTPVAMAAQAAPLVAVVEPSSPNPTLTSAHEIVAMPEAEFVQTYSPAVGGEDVARILYRNAKDTEARTMLLWANARALAAAPHFQSMRVNNISNSLVEHFQSLPSYQDMFGSLNYCECEHCRSIFSPAAYFVDLMRIAKENIKHKAPEPGELNFSLDARRPDLKDIPLTCENTNNEIPYLDIVNKALALNAAKVGVVSYWPLDEGNGQSIGDQIDSNTGTLQGKEKWVTATDFPGVARRSVLQFDGTSNYVTIPNSDSLNFDYDQDFTIEAWIKADPVQPYTTDGNKPIVDNTIIEKCIDSSNYPYAIRYYNQTTPGEGSGTIYAARYDDPHNPTIGSKTKVNDGKFHHIVFTKQGSQLYLYIDGDLQGQTEDTTKTSTKNNSPVFIASRTLTSHFFKGQIAGVCIRNSSLSDTTIKLLAQTPVDLSQEEEAINFAYQNLATANYPFNLPFNLPLEQIRAYLRQLNTDLASIYRVFGVSEDAIARESLGLSIEEYNLIINPKPDLDDLRIVYDLPIDELGYLIYTDIFLHQTGLSRQDLHNLCYQNLSQDEVANGIAKSFFINQKSQQATYFQTSENTVSYWPLNEGSGTSIGDRIGSNNGTLQGAATWGTTIDFPGTASRPVLQFDGTSNYVTLANASELGLTDSDFTVEAWFKADDLSSHQAILCTDAYSDNRGLHLMIMNQKAYMGFYANDLAGQTTLVGGRWYHIVWRYTKSTGEQAIFINGELDASSQGHLPFAGKTSVNIGRWAGATYFKGQIAEVRIWNTALSNNEVRSHYRNPNSPDPATLDRVNRFIRLARKLNWSFADLDWVLTSLKASEITSDTIQKIAKIKLLKDKLNLPLDVLCSFWYDLKTIGVGDSISSQALFDVVFNNSQLLGPQDPYHPEYKDQNGKPVNPMYQDKDSKLLKSSKDNSRVVAGLQTSLDDVTTLIKAFWTNEASVDLTVQNLSTLYRHSKLAALLKLPTEQYLLFLNLLGKQKPVFEFQEIIDIFDFAIWLRLSGFNVYELDYILNDRESKYVTVRKSDEEIQEFLQLLQSLNINNQALLGFWWRWYRKIQNDRLLKAEALDLWFISLAYHLISRRANNQTSLLEHLAIFVGSTADIIKPLLELIAKRLTLPETKSSYSEAFLDPSPSSLTLDYIYRVFRTLSRELLFYQKLQLTQAEMKGILSQPQYYKIDPDLQAITLDNLRSLFTFKALVRSFDDTQNGFLQFIDLINQPPESQPLDDQQKAKAKTLDQQNKSLASITGWDKDQIEKLRKDRFPNALNSITGIAQLKQVFDLSSAIGVNISFHDQVLALADSSKTAPTSWADYKNAAQSVLEVVKAKYHDDDWVKVSDRLNRSLNESKRNALASFVLWQLQQRDASIETLRQLSEYLLLDVETTGCASISPIKQATLSLQMYLQRCRMNLEPGVVKVDIPAIWWEWMMNYRVWEANRKVFLYPENYIEPNLRKDKTDLFKELESELLQTEITQESVEAAYRNYFDKLTELAKLRVAATYRCHVQKNDATSNNPTDDTLFIFGKTATEPRTYYYRTCINPTATPPTWNPWTKIDLNINSDYISPVFAFNKLFVFWVEIKETTDSSMDGGKTQKTTTRKATIKYTFQTVSQKWVQPQTLCEDIVISRQDTSYQENTSHQTQNIDPIWRKVYSVPLPGKDLSSRKMLVAFGDLQISCYISDSIEYKFSNFGVTLSDNLVTESTPLSLKIESSQKALLNNYIRDLSSSHLWEGAVGSWLLNEGHGKTIYDQVGNRNGTVIGNAQWTTVTNFPGNSSRSVLQFSGSQNDFVSLPSMDIDYSQGFTVAAWVYYDSFENWSRIIDFGNGSLSDNILLANKAKDNTLIFEVWTGNQPFIIEQAEALETGHWIHLTATIDSSGYAYLYKGGQLIRSGQLSLPRKIQRANNYIGKSNWDADSGFHGKITNISVWNKVLTPEQVRLLISPKPIFNLIKANSSISEVKNQPGWFIYDNVDEAFLVVPNGLSSSPISEALEIQEFPSFSTIGLSYQGTAQSTPNHFICTRLTTSTTRQLSQKAFVGGMDYLLTLDSQLTPEPNFQRFNPSEDVKAPTSQVLDFKGAFGLYFWEIFFHIPFLVANTLNANQRFAEAQKWYHYIFNPTQPQLPQAIAYWPLDEGSGTGIGDRVSNNKGTLQNTQWIVVTDFPASTSRPVLQFDGKTSYVEISSTAINDLNSGTIAAWVYLEDNHCVTILSKQHDNWNTYVVFSIGYSVNQNGSYQIGDPGRLYFHSFNAGGRIASNATINTHQWTHVAVTFSKQSATLYINGKASGEGSGDFSVPDDPNVTATRIGSWRRSESEQYSLSGKLANVRIWNTVLSPEQILDSAARSLCDRFWRYLPFRGNTLEKLQELLRNDKAVTAYNNDPFDPHAIAQLRIGAYQKAIVMKYIDNLLDWGDSLYAQDTWESITQATMLYLLAYDLLGPKPEDLGKCPVPSPKTFDEIQKENPTKIPQFLIDLEQIVGNSQTSTLTSTPFNNLNTYFGISENEQFIAYWDRVEDRLYKIRHCQNLEGIVRQLALYEPPINPMELVRAVAAGNVPMSVVSGLTATVPHYRFDHMLERAKNITSTLIQLGSSLLSALEKKDAEQLSLLRASQEAAILKLIKTTKENQVKEAQANLESLNKSLVSANNRVNYYNNLIQGGWNDAEREGRKLTESSLGLSSTASLLSSIASPAYAQPTIFGLADGGFSIGGFFAASADSAAHIANQLSSGSSLSAMIAQYQRRAEEWKFQFDMANDESTLINQQIATAQINIEIATSELNAHQKSIEHADEVENFFKTKFSTPDLYQWMVSRLSTLYFQTFKIALDMALAAQKAYQYELNKDDTYISFDYWDSLKKGLLAGEGLMLGLNQLEKAYLEGNERRLEIEKTISLLQLDPQAFLNLKNTGTCQFSLSEKLFDYDFPGHYCRQIKTISISIPAVVGPYQNIKATLTQLSDKTLLKPDSDVVQKSLKSESVSQVDPSILRTSWRRNQKIALSKGINDTGLFELSFRDERYLPFEGTGAISTWELSLPKSTNQINFDNLTDVIITLSYTALAAGEGTFKQTVQTALNPCEWFYYISLNQTFPSEWHTFVTSKKMNFTLSPSILPSHMTKVQLKGVSLSLDGSVSTPGSITLTISPPSASPTTINSTQFANLAVSSDQFSGEWSFTGLPENIENLELVLKFSGEINWNS